MRRTIACHGVTAASAHGVWVVPTIVTTISYLPPILPPGRGSLDLFDLREVISASSRRAFAGVPWMVYRGDPYWTPPLLSDRRRALELTVKAEGLPLHPDELGLFYAESRSLTAASPATGSIAVWPGKTRADAHFGMFEVVNNQQIAEALFDAGETWLFEHAGRLKAVRGPMSLQPLLLPGVLVDGFSERPAATLPYNPPYYPDTLEAAGYIPSTFWSAYEILLDEIETEQDGTPKERAPARTRGTTAPRPDWAALAARYTEAASELVPGLAICLEELGSKGSVTSEGLSRQGRYLINRLWRRALAVALTEAGSGPCIGLPDLSDALRWMNGRLLPFGWIALTAGLVRTRTLHIYPPALERTDPVLVQQLCRAMLSSAQTAGYRRMVIAPVRDEHAASGEALARFGARRTHRYAIYEKKF